MSLRVLSVTAATVLVVLVSALFGGGLSPAVSATSPTTPTTPENPSPPVVVIGSATAITTSTALLAATIDPGSAATTYAFQYGTSTSYGLTTPTGSLAAGNVVVPVNASIKGLTVSTTYHFRITATNAAGTVVSADKTFKTAAAPKAPSVETRAATAVTATSANFVGRVNPQGQATTSYFQWGTNTKYGQTTPVVVAGGGTGTLTLTAPITGLTPRVTYYYRVVASNKTGTKYGSARKFTTAPSVAGVTIRASTTRPVWGGTTAIGGAIGGIGVGGVKVNLMRQDWPFTAAFRQIATATTTAGGTYGFTVGPLYSSTKLQVVTQTSPASSSPVSTINSRLLTRLRITERKASKVRLRVYSYPYVPAAKFSVQRKTKKGRWIRIKFAKQSPKTAVDRSKLSVSVPRYSRATRIRVIITPNDGGAHVRTTSKSVLVPKKN